MRIEVAVNQDCEIIGSSHPELLDRPYRKMYVYVNRVAYTVEARRGNTTQTPRTLMGWYDKRITSHPSMSTKDRQMGHDIREAGGANVTFWLKD